MCPVIVAGGLYAFLGFSSKRADLLRDGRYGVAIATEHFSTLRSLDREGHARKLAA
jgi:hypothetical protein